MISTRNTSKSYVNPPRMQDQQGDVDSRPPAGTLEAIQANTNEMEALRLTNQLMLRELEQLTRQLQHPQEARQAREGPNPSPKKSSNTSTLLEEQMEKEKLPKLGSVILTNLPERIAMRKGIEGTIEATDPYPSLISRK